jgi:hypothetical protein
MSLGLYEELNDGSFDRSGRVPSQGAEIETLDMETFEVVQRSCTDNPLAHGWRPIEQQSRAIDSLGFES